MIYNVIRKQPNSKKCFACGIENAFGLNAFFYELENNELVAIFKTMEEHQSYPGIVHGGIAATMLDETIGRTCLAAFNGEIWGVTMEMTVKYLKPIPLMDEIRVVARMTKEEKRIFEGTGEILLKNGDVAATGFGRYMKLPLAKITDIGSDAIGWKVTNSENDPVQIEV